MKRTISLFALLFILVGCVPSLHSLYTEEDLISDPALVGVWKEADDGGKKASWAFTAADNKAYSLLVTDEDGKTGNFEAHLLKLKGVMFLDLFPDKLESSQSDFYKGHLVPAHSFVRVDQIVPTLRLRDMNFDWMKNFLKDKPAALAHEKMDDAIVLTASTKDLQSFVAAHMNDEGMFDEKTELKRQEVAPAAKP
jgi:hypothetical protein